MPKSQSLAQKVDPDRIPRILLANLYPKEVWYCLGVFIALLSLCHLISVLYAYSTRHHVSQPRANAALRHGLSWRRLPLAFLNLWRTVAFRWSITLWSAYTFNVADFVLTAMYIAVLFTWTMINSKNTLGQKYDPKYWANRCAHIAAVQLPLMTALGMKNNFLSFLTGVSFDKLEYLHRMSARVICVMFWVHAFGRVSLTISAADASTPWLRIGAAGTSSLTLLCFLSIRPLRARAYEFFLVIHLLLGVLALAGAYVHASEFGYQVYVWPALFLWGLDRVLRLARALLVNAQLWDGKRTVASNATVSVLSPHFLRVLVDVPPFLRWLPGQCVYLTLLGARSSIEAHPFTIAYASFSAQDDGDAPAESEKSSATARTSSERLAFILRVRAGFTRRLHDSISITDEGSKDFKALLDGPYSSPPMVKGFERVVFICGGSGVSFCLPLFLDLVQAARTSNNPRCSRILFVWAIRDRDQIDWIKDATTRAVSSNEQSLGIDINIQLYLTAAPEDTQVLSQSGGDPESSDYSAGTGTHSPMSDDEPEKRRSIDSGHPVPGVPFARLVRGRPDIKHILDTELEQARGGAVSVNVCGTPELGASVRGVLARGAAARFVDVLKGGPSVVLHVEGFGTGSSG